MHRLDFLTSYLKGKRILDIGNLANGGVVHQMLIDRFTNSEFFGLDVVDQQSCGLSFKNQSIGSIEQNSYAADFFDCIYMGEVLEHTWKPKDMTDACYRILKKGGILILDTPNVYSLSRMIRYMMTGKDIILGDPDHKIFYSRAMLEHLLASSGFLIEQITSEMNFDTRKLKFALPHIGAFRYMGECLLVLARK